jgi:hypothetical protein
MNILQRLRDLGVDLDSICDHWETIRRCAVADDPQDLTSLSRTIEDQQHLFSNEPVLGAPKWLVEEVVPLGNRHYAVLMHDGHIENCAVVHYEAGRLDILFESGGTDEC